MDLREMSPAVSTLPRRVRTADGQGILGTTPGRERLSDLELAVLDLATAGKTTVAIGAELGLPHSAVMTTVISLVRAGQIASQSSNPCQSGACAATDHAAATGSIPAGCASCPLSKSIRKG